MALSPSYVSLSTGYCTLVDFLTPGVVTLGIPSSSSRLMSESLDSPPARDVPPCSAIFSLPFLGLFAWADPLLSVEFLSLPLHHFAGIRSHTFRHVRSTAGGLFAPVSGGENPCACSGQIGETGTENPRGRGVCGQVSVVDSSPRCKKLTLWRD